MQAAPVAKVLLVGRNQTNNAAFAKSLKRRYDVTIVSSGKAAIETSAHFSPHVIVLDAASMQTPGDRLCRSLRAALPQIPIIHIHPGPKGAVESVADALLILPFTSRKLINSIERLVEFSDDAIITCGALQLNIERRRLLVRNQETQLTPKAALLLEAFMRQPGKVLDRKTLMSQIWETDYLGDTRTLNVHIRWLRNAIEQNPNKPRLLVTVRGVGYRFDCETAD
jgi:DNA-binding response OmpR family regulator